MRRADNLTTCADCLEIWEPQPPGNLGACPGLEWDCFTFTFTSVSRKGGARRMWEGV